MRHALAKALGLSILLGSTTGFAQEFGSQGVAVFGAERLFGFHAARTTTESPGGDDEETDTTAFGFAWQGENTRSPYDAPRAAFDYFLIDHLSLGGALTYADVSIEGDVDIVYFMVSPRVGYAHMFSPTIGVWPRGGFTFHSAANDDFEVSGFGLSLECMFPVVPSEHFAFEFGPTLDMDLSGEADPDLGGDYDLRYRSFGLRVGLMGWL